MLYRVKEGLQLPLLNNQNGTLSRTLDKGSIVRLVIDSSETVPKRLAGISLTIAMMKIAGMELPDYIRRIDFEQLTQIPNVIIAPTDGNPVFIMDMKAILTLKQILMCRDST
jgi:hypothetical protein